MSALTRSTTAFLSSSIGRKIIVAVTGLALIGFLAGHLVGNLLIFTGREAFNEYAEFLHSVGHGAGIWVARIGLLAAVGAHIYFTIKLTMENKAARPKYAYEGTIGATKNSRIMAISGLTILSFIIFHILHFTVRTDSELAQVGATDPWQMVIIGFQNIWVVIFYLISMGLLCSHLSHGFSSVFQTLGISTEKTRAFFDKIGVAYAWLIFVGFASIPISIFFGLVG